MVTELFRFVDVRCDSSDRTHSFTLHSGEVRLLQFSSKAEKDAIIDLATGETQDGEGTIEIVQGERRGGQTKEISAQEERRRRNAPVPMIWQALSASRPGRVGWVAGNGGLISNLKIWENVTLPLWYHAQHDVADTEQRVLDWLGVLGLEPSACADFMAAPPYSVEPWERKLAGLLRALVQMPRVLIVDAVVFEDVKARLAHSWIQALEAYAAQGRTVLVVADKATILPWKKIE